PGPARNLRDRGARGGRSVRARHSEDVLADVRHHEVLVHGRGLVQTRLAERALDVVLFGVAVAAVAVDTRVAGLPRRLRGEEFRHVGFGAARLARVEQRGGLITHQRGGLHAHVRLRDGKLHALVVADRLAYGP